MGGLEGLRHRGLLCDRVVERKRAREAFEKMKNLVSFYYIKGLG